MISKRQFIRSTAALSLVAAIGATLPAHSAEKADKPVRGLSFTIQAQTSGEVIAQYKASSGTLKVFNKMQGSARSSFLTKLLVKELNAQTKHKNWDKSLPALREKMGARWCGPCKLIEGRTIRKIEFDQVPPEFKDGISAFITASF